MLKFTHECEYAAMLNYEHILRGWHTLQKPLTEATSISWCIQIYRYEQKHKNRRHILERIRARAAGIGVVQLRDFLDEEIFTDG